MAASSIPETVSMLNGADLSWVSSLTHSPPKSPKLSWLLPRPGPSSPALFCRAPQLVLPFGHFKVFAWSPGPAPWSPAVAKPAKSPSIQGAGRRGEAQPGPLEMSTYPGTPLHKEPYLRVLPISRDKSGLSWVRSQRKRLCPSERVADRPPKIGPKKRNRSEGIEGTMKVQGI